MTDHPITPPPELLQQWATEYWGNPGELIGNGEKYIAIQAARWGADQELEACCTWLNNYMGRLEADDLREARRPGAPSLKEQALEALEREEADSCSHHNLAIIRRALEQLDD